ncbi:hypothetical protein GYMLUDRAFT_43410 [Collybiopsis luxurians FD-317 M1]|uniref:Uncharacterized protein n=1 Tax=Collybiopsis luxurians FD-317 M1 TaxID=944289 RepID=A0A0D0CX74_9AGAR|nr:hypothetical protein GYMLUDRAFT_43410 [Collybiopsis luxurians FD-317 M1]
MASSYHHYSSPNHRTQERSNSHSERRNTNPHVTSHGAPHASSSRPDPTVLYRSHDWENIRSEIRPGAFSAVAKNQVIQRRSSHSTSSPNHPPSHNQQTHHTPETDLSVLFKYRRHDSRNPYASPSGTTFGKASFSAVAGHQDFIYGRDQVYPSASTHHHVLDYQDHLPGADTYTSEDYPLFHPGSNSAVHGHSGPGCPRSPSVLMDAQGFRAERGTFEEGSFSAVGGNQEVWFYEPQHHRHYDHRDYRGSDSHHSRSSRR